MATKEEILDAISNMTVLELSELLKDFEERFGVTVRPRIGFGRQHLVAARQAPEPLAQTQPLEVAFDPGHRRRGGDADRHVECLGLVEPREDTGVERRRVGELVLPGDATRVERRIQRAPQPTLELDERVVVPGRTDAPSPVGDRQLHAELGPQLRRCLVRGPFGIEHGAVEVEDEHRGHRPEN